jgi:hypothetical protein
LEFVAVGGGERKDDYVDGWDGGEFKADDLSGVEVVRGFTIFDLRGFGLVAACGE